MTTPILSPISPNSSDKHSLAHPQAGTSASIPSGTSPSALVTAPIKLLRQLGSNVWKEFLEVSHDRTMLAVLIIFPIFIMLFMGSSFHSMEISGLPVGVVGPQNTSFSTMLLSGLNTSKAFNLHSFDAESDAMDSFRNGQLKAVIIIPEDFEQTLAKGNGSHIRILVDNSDLALEQSIIAALSAVVQASSTDITKTYVTAAWADLGSLNRSAAALADDVSTSRVKMNQTKARLQEIKQRMDELNVARLGDSIDSASGSVATLRQSLFAQRAAVERGSQDNNALMQDTALFLQNASLALNDSINMVQETHGKLLDQEDNLTKTSEDLQSAISGLEAIKGTTSDPALRAALDLNILSLQSLHNTTEQQIADVRHEIVRLEALNTTLYGFSGELESYSATAAAASSSAGVSSAAMLAAIDNATAQLDSLNTSFASASADVNQLKDVLNGITNAMDDMETTLDRALAQTASVDRLISSLRSTVETQTARDPARIAAPLSVDVQGHYVRSSFVDFLMPQVIAVSLLFSCFLLASISLVREKTGNTIIRALMSPFGLESLVAGKVLSIVLLSIGQVALILVVALAIFGVKPPTDLVVLALGTVISSLVLASIGVLIGFYARTESAAIQTCLLLAIPMLFLGNIVFSPDLLPAYTQVLQQLLPLAHVTNIYKVVLVTGGNPAVDLAALWYYFILLAVALAIIVVKRRDITNYQ